MDKKESKKIIPVIIIGAVLILGITLASTLVFVIREKSHRDKMDDLIGQNDTLNSILEEQEDQIGDLQDANDDLDSQNDELNRQNDELNQINDELESQVEDLKQEVDELQGRVSYSETAFNYLAIGNSITIHRESDYWWSASGMAASRPENDYYHLVTDYLRQIYPEVGSYAVNFSQWEFQSYDRAETYSIIDPYLSSELDLVTIQLSENVTNMSTFESDFESLIEYVKLNAPNARILIIDDFWDDGSKSEIKEAVAGRTGVAFLSLDEIKDDPEYQCGENAVVYDSEGQEHIVDHEGVELHPGDKGMLYIADTIINALNN